MRIAYRYDAGYADREQGYADDERDSLVQQAPAQGFAVDVLQAFDEAVRFRFYVLEHGAGRSGYDRHGDNQRGDQAV